MKHRFTAFVLVMASCAMGGSLQAQEAGESILSAPATETEALPDEKSPSIMMEEPMAEEATEEEPVKSEMIEKSGTVLDMPPAPAEPPPPRAMPIHGMKMNEVERQYGTPLARHPAVGDPPISRWDYDGFSVFFEHSTVLHSVQQGRPAEIYRKEELLPASTP